MLNHQIKDKIDLKKKYVVKDLTIKGNVGQMHQAFLNIIVNAIDALQNNRDKEHKVNESPTLTIRTETTGSNTVKISIADNGNGMTEEVRSKIFDPFYTTKPVGSGTGLGLSISYSVVVEKHGGSLTCNSAPGEGAEFVIEIPVQPK
jgi:signal transduction histidine kinase